MSTPKSDVSIHTSRFTSWHAAVAYFVLTIALTWPLARGLARDLPADLGDPLLNCWVLAWDAEHLLRALAGHVDALAEYWNANIYYPHPLALAYSEHLTAQAVLILPVYAITRNPILCYNVAFLLTFVLSALGMFLFVRAITGSTGAAFVAGLAFGFAPYRFGTLPHVQVLSSMWMPVALLGFHRFLDERRLAPLAGAASAWIAQNLSCGYYLLFFSPMIALYLALEITRRRLWTDRRVLAGIAASFVVVAGVTLPFLLPYWHLRQLGFAARSLAETTRYSGDVLGYLTTDTGMWMWGHIVRAWPASEGSLFPGIAVSVLAAVGIAAHWRLARREVPARHPSALATGLTVLLVIVCVATAAILVGYPLHASIGGLVVRFTRLDRGIVLIAAVAATLGAVSRRARRIAVRWLGSRAGTLAIATAFAFAMSLGPQVHAHGRTVADTNIYGAFYGMIPGFDGLRVPARYAMLVALGLAALAGEGAAALLRRRHGTIVVAFAAVFMVAESWAAPIPINVNSTDYKQAGLAPLPDTLTPVADTPAVYRFVAVLPGNSALIELPFGEIAFETRYMFYSTRHWRRLVNGYSGGGPDEYGLRVERFKDILTRPDEAWQAVVESRATHLIVHEGSYADDRGRRITDWALAHGATEIGVFGSDHVLAVRRN